MNANLVNIRTIETQGKGSLSFIESERDIPIQIKRIYYIYQVDEGIQRGGHAHRKLKQLLVCIHGCIEIVLDDGFSREAIILDSPCEGLFVEDLIWREMIWRTLDAVLMVAASEYYDENDYIRNYDEFLAAAKKKLG